jgi:3-phosphoshikimate 1-carboxyvinyltransferase
MTARRGGPLTGTAEVPGDKSISHRALILGALSVGETRVTGLLEGQDVLDTARAMQAFGAGVERLGPENGGCRAWGSGASPSPTG